MSTSQEYFKTLSEIKKRDVEVLLKKSYRGIWEGAIKKYSGNAHFIYELLQNADDAKATNVEFDLEENGLWFKHNGSERFTVSDPLNEDFDSENGTLGHINSITSIGNSNKIDEQKIGKFGIGFKAVFAYSSTPHIYDDIFNFKLDNYIVPIKIEGNYQRKKTGETLFYFPFNHDTKIKEEALSEIENKIRSLYNPLLFLKNLKQIKWTSVKNNGKYLNEVLSKKTFPTETNSIRVEHIALKKEENGLKEKQEILLFTKEFSKATNPKNYEVSVGYYLEKGKLIADNKKVAFCFFPTKEQTDFGFIVHAPFLLTDSREKLKAGDKWNELLISSLAYLAAKSLTLLKQIKIRENEDLINDDIFDIIPYVNKYDYLNEEEEISFEPIYKAILKKFETEQLLPGKEGKFFDKSKAYLATDSELVELFSDYQISQLMENPNSGWVFTSKRQKQFKQSDHEYIYLIGIISDYLDPKKLLRRITEEFIERQSDEWLLRFYTYLGGRKHLWDDKDKLALRRPILLNQRRKAVIPFDQQLTTPNIFLPTDQLTSYDTIYKPFIYNKDAYDFFVMLGIGKPDLKAEIYKKILPQYKNKFDYNNSALLLQHFESFLIYYEESSLNQQSEFINNLKEVTILAARKQETPNTRFFCLPRQIYFNNKELETFFLNSKKTYTLDKQFYSEIINRRKESFFKMLQDLGVSDIPRIIELDLPVDYSTKELFGLEDIEVSPSKYYYGQQITDKKMEGLEEAINELNLELSLVIWNFLLKHIDNKTLSEINSLFLGTFRYVPKWQSWYYNKEFESTLSSILKNDTWLYDNDGNLIPANELTTETINPAYNIELPQSRILLNFLGIEDPYSNLDLPEEQLIALKIGQKLLDQGLTETELNELLEFAKSLKQNKIATELEQVISDDQKSDIENISDEDINQTIESIKKGITDKKKKRKAKTEPDTDINTPEPQLQPQLEPIIDQDDLTPPPINTQKEIEIEKEKAEARIERISILGKLNEIVETSEKYSYAWFKALLELEYLNSSELNSNGKQISIQFAKVEKGQDTERTLILKHPNRYIPQTIEDIGDIQIRIYQGEEVKSVTVEVVSVKEYSLRAKLKKSADVNDIDLDKITRAVLDIKNPIFIIEELRKAFYQLDFEDSYSLKQNLTENIRFIFGPPGTGKTYFLAEKEIIPLMQQQEDKKVLVLVPTNKSADVLTKQIMKLMGSDESYYSWLIRFGTTADSEVENSHLVVDKGFDIRTKPRNTTITTIARFAYDYFLPEGQLDRFHLKYLQWDYVVIDEASMINLASIAYVLYQLKDSQFIIAGDPFQIQPITQIEQWKDMNIYEMVQLNKFTNPTTEPHPFDIINLKKQYRSIPTIGNLFSQFTYDGILEHDRNFQDQKPLKIDGLDFRDINIIKFPVSKYESIYKPNSLNKSNYHIYSALFTVEFVVKLIDNLEKVNDEKYKIGIICPYKAQATLMDKVLAQTYINNSNADYTVGTIHGFQGDQCDIIISLFNPPLNISKSPNLFLNKQNILNVAISRARDYLFILMPDNNTQDIDNLYKLNKIVKLAHSVAKSRITVYKSEIIEDKLFKNKSYIFENSFATSHQSVNVYSKPENKYEVRCEEVAVDVQIKL